MGIRDRGTISEAYLDTGHGHKTVWVTVEYDAGGTQGFGGLALDTWQWVYARDLCDTFGVPDLDHLAGQECHALRLDDSWGAAIVGLESCATRRTFTHDGFRRKYQLNGPQAAEPPEDPPPNCWERLIRQ